MSMKVMYLCDGEKPECNKKYCYKSTGEETCRHTSDIKHAINFKKKENPAIGEIFWEQSSGTNIVDHADMTDYDINELP